MNLYLIRLFCFTSQSNSFALPDIFVVLVQMFLPAFYSGYARSTMSEWRIGGDADHSRQQNSRLSLFRVFGVLNFLLGCRCPMWLDPAHVHWSSPDVPSDGASFYQVRSRTHLRITNVVIDLQVGRRVNRLLKWHIYVFIFANGIYFWPHITYFLKY